MTVAYTNFDYFYRGPKGKPVFVPSDKGRELGNELKQLIEARVEFDNIYSHYRAGGHVAALHEHRQNKFFAKLDLKNFFYTIARNRAGHALYKIGIEDPGEYARWSTVKNPYQTPSYALPYGFVQSPAIATIVLKQSELGSLALKLSATMTVSVYLDDVSVSSDSKEDVGEALNALATTAAKSGFVVNEKKLFGPSETIELFNCRLEHSVSEVTEARRREFYSVDRSQESRDGFERYCASVIGLAAGT